MSVGRRPKRRGGSRMTVIITAVLSRSWQRGQFWKGDDAAELETVKRHEGQVRYDKTGLLCGS
jgi:hypothetical protein